MHEATSTTTTPTVGTPVRNQRTSALGRFVRADHDAVDFTPIWVVTYDNDPNRQEWSDLAENFDLVAEIPGFAQLCPAPLAALLADPRITLVLVEGDDLDLDDCGECPEDWFGAGDDRERAEAGAILIEDIRTYVHRDNPRDVADAGRVHGFAYRSTACDTSCLTAALRHLLTHTVGASDVRVTVWVDALVGA